MGRKKISTTVYLDAWQDAALKGLKLASSIPVANMIRDAIDEYLEDRLDHKQIAEYKREASSDGMVEEMEALKDRIASLETMLDEQRRLIKPSQPDDGEDESEPERDTEE
jgi:hypothetical protein